MNVVREIQNLNRRELELGISGSASWHHEYRHSAYIFIGNLDYRLSEGDILVAFSQFGEIVDLRLCRDKKSGKPMGFAFLAYEDQRSTILAVDNMNGATLLGRTLRVDHAARYTTPVSRKHVEGEVDDERYDSDSDYEERRRLIWDYEAYDSDKDEWETDADLDLPPQQEETALFGEEALSATITSESAADATSGASMASERPGSTHSQKKAVDVDAIAQTVASQSLLRPVATDAHSRNILDALEARRRERELQRMQEFGGSELTWRVKGVGHESRGTPGARGTRGGDNVNRDGRHRESSTDRDREADRGSNRYRNRDSYRDGHRDRDRDRDREREGERYRGRQRSSERERGDGDRDRRGGNRGRGDERRGERVDVSREERDSGRSRAESRERYRSSDGDRDRNRDKDRHGGRHSRDRSTRDRR